MSVPSLFRSLFESADHDHRFLTVPGEAATTYGAMNDRSAYLAGALVAAGTVAGDRVVVQVDKSIDAVALYLACLRAAFVYVPLNTAYTAPEIAYFLDDTGASVFISAPGADDDVVADRSHDLVHLTLGAFGEGTLAELAETVEPFTDVRELSGPACLLYTSGTTGRSKGAMLGQRRLLENGRALHAAWQFEAGDVLLHTLPIFHVHGLFVALHCAMLNGSEVIFCPRFDPAMVTTLLPESTVMMGVPTHYVRLLADPDFGPAACDHMRLFTSGSAPMTARLHQQFAARSGHQIVERYGMTETLIMTTNPYDGERLPGTVGYPIPGVELRVVDGVVQVRGAHLFDGYWRLPEKTAESTTDDGFFITGDIGELDHTGRLTLSGRAGDMIISGGYNVYPKEVEMVLDQCDGIVESAVVGVPHTDFGEEVVAVIALDPSPAGQHDVMNQGDAVESALRLACDRALGRFKHPRRYVFVDALPRNTMGKVQKAELRRQLTPPSH